MKQVQETIDDVPRSVTLPLPLVPLTVFSVDSAFLDLPVRVGREQYLQ